MASSTILRASVVVHLHKYAIAIFLCMLVANPIDVFSQKAAWNWYFGNGAGLTFKNGFAEPVSDGKVFTNEGCAAISDTATGELLFYTDGITVWNGQHQVMVNGTGLNGDISTSQSAVIVPWIGNPSVYFIFNPAAVTSANIGDRCFCLYYSVVDLRKDNGRGEVVLKNLSVASDITEHVTATMDCRNEGWWIVAKSRLSNTYYSFHLTADRLESTPVVSVADPDRPLVVRDVGQMHISPDGQKLVITSTSGNSQIADFDPITGIVSNAFSLFPAPSSGSHYGAAFSRNSKSVFIAVTNDGTAVAQSIYGFNIDQPINSLVAGTRRLIGEMPENFSWTPMQLGPDGNIYVGTPSKNSIGVISDADSLGQEKFVESALTVTGTCTSGLPNFPGSMLRVVSRQDLACTAPEARIVNTVGCQDNCTRFTDNSVGFIDKWFWTFQGGVPNISEDKNPSCVVYASPGVYPVRLIVYNKYGPDTAFASVTILEKPTITAAGATTICRGASVKLTANGGSTYLWSPASSLDNPTSATPTASPLTTTTYSVIGTGPTGCKDTAKVTVTVALMSATGTATICKGASVVLQAVGGTEYSWSPSAGLSSTTIANPTATPGSTTTYVVRIKNKDCEVLDTVIVTVVDNIKPTISGVTQACAGDTILLTASNGGTTYEWSGVGVLDKADATTRVIASTTATYRVVTFAGNCRDSSTWDVVVVPRPTLVGPPDTTICKGQALQLDVSTQADSVVWQPAVGLNVTVGKSVIATPDSSTTYIISAFANGLCEVLDTVRVTVKESETVSAGPDKNICAGQGVMLNATTSASKITWFPVTGLSDPTIINPVASPPATTRYIVTVGEGDCAATDTVVVVVSSVDLSLSKDTSICPGESVRLFASGATKFLWSPSAGLSDPTVQNPVATPNVSTRYFVTATDQYGCTSSGQVTVSLRKSTNLKVNAGIVHTEVGTQDVGIPLIVTANPDALPIFIQSMSAKLVVASNAFFPTSVDRGNFAATLRDSFWVAYITLNNIAIISAEQKITEIRGTALLGNTDATDFVWESIIWSGAAECPSTTTENGLLIVTGCNLQFRRLKGFDLANLTVQPQPSDDVVEIGVTGSEAGRYVATVWGVDGRKWFQKTFHKIDGDSSEVYIAVDMSTFGTGTYLVVLQTPFSVQSQSIVWMRQ